MFTTKGIEYKIRWFPSLFCYQNLLIEFGTNLEGVNFKTISSVLIVHSCRKLVFNFYSYELNS